MKLKLNKEEIKSVILDILCNSGISMLDFITVDYSQEHYHKVKADGDCFEDVLYKILEDGGILEFIDDEYDGDYSRDLTMGLINQRLNEIDSVDFTELITTSLNEESDALTGYELIQWFLYGESIFG
jgi:hypothetical protein